MIEAAPYGGGAEEWDAVVEGAPMTTFLHTRRFLDHHGERYRDASLLILDEGDVVGVLPAAAHPAEEGVVVSHPGATYGGIVHQGRLAGERMVETLEAIRSAYRDQGFGSLVYKAVPHIYHQLPCEDDLYGLFRLGASRVRVDLSCAIDLDSRRPPASRRRRGTRRAHAEGIEVTSSPDVASALWPVLEDNLRDRHGVRPVHTVEEILHLHRLFPTRIAFVAAMLGGDVVAGAVTFASRRVVHAQYIAAGERGRKASALDAVFEHCIDGARSAGARYFDFGISTTDEGTRLNSGLYGFKLEFGGGGVTYETYRLPLAGQSTVTR